MNLYLTYLDTYEEEGETYYRFQAGLFSGSALEDWLLLASELSMIELLSLPSYIPATIEAEMVVKSWAGSSFEVPETLYFHWIEGLDFFASDDSIYDVDDFLLDGLGAQPIIVYKTETPGPSSVFPAARDPFGTEAPNSSTYPNWFVPDLVGEGILIVASRKSSFPFWTHANFSRFFAYGAGPYNCEGLPYNIHVTCPGLGLDEYIGDGFFEEDGYYRNLRSDLEGTGYAGMTITYVTDGNLQDLELGGVGMPDEMPVIYWNPAIFVEPEPGKDSGIVTTLLSVGFLIANLTSTSLPILRHAELYAERQNWPLGINIAGVKWPLGINIAGVKWPNGYKEV